MSDYPEEFYFDLTEAQFVAIAALVEEAKAAVGPEGERPTSAYIKLTVPRGSDLFYGCVAVQIDASGGPRVDGRSVVQRVLAVLSKDGTHVAYKGAV